MNRLNRVLAAGALVAAPWLAALPNAVAQETTPVVRVYRMVQAGAEVGRETYRAAGNVHEFSVVVPVLNLKIDSRLELSSAGRVAGFESRVFNAAGDSARATYRLAAEGDSMRWTAEQGGSTRQGTIRGVADGVIPAQSIAVMAFAVERAGGRDTVLRMLPMGGDSLMEIAVRHGGDSVSASIGPLVARTTVRQGRSGHFSVPLQRLQADIWNGVDSLPPLAGLRRPPVDYAAPPGARYSAEEVRVPIRTLAGDTFSLACTLTLPLGSRAPHPVVVTQTGSGGQPRDEDLWPLLQDYRPFREVAERLADVGIGVLRCDDRGVGESGGRTTNPTTADLADDARQTLAWLRARPGINGDRLAIAGHSEGGAIAILAAAEDRRLAAIVIMAGPGKVGRAILRDQFERPIRTAQGLSESDRATLLAGVDRSIEEWVASNRWTRWFADWDPIPVARSVHQPVLIQHGALDRQVSVGQADTLAVAMRRAGNQAVTVRVYPRLNHLFLPTDGDGSPSEYLALRQTSLPREVLDDMATWLRARLVRRRAM